MAEVHILIYMQAAKKIMTFVNCDSNVCMKYIAAFVINK